MLDSSGLPRRIGRVSHVAIYPVKGCARIELASARLTPSGLEGDREYMIVREETDSDGVHHFVTQRDKRNRSEAKPQGLAAMALIRPEVTTHGLQLTWKGADPIDVVPEEKSRMKVRVHSDVVSAEDQGAPVARWLSEHLRSKVRLVRAGGEFHRLASQTYMKSTNQVNFQDAYPVHWVMQESVDELSRVAGEMIPWTSFRPNIVGEGGEPGIEHKIHRGWIGEVEFIQPKPCTRCPVTTVDQETGEKRGTEPLKSLSTYKRWDRTKELIFGENVLPLRNGSIKTDDEITMSTARDPPILYGRLSTEGTITQIRLK